VEIEKKIGNRAGRKGSDFSEIFFFLLFSFPNPGKYIKKKNTEQTPYIKILNLAGDRTQAIALHSKHFARRQNGQSADDKKRRLNGRATLKYIPFFVVLLLDIPNHYLIRAFRI